MKIISDALSDDIIKLCNDDIDSKTKEKVWVSNLAWDDELYEGISGACLVSSLSPSNLLSVRTKLIKNFPKYNSLKLNYYYWMRQSGINWHDDGRWLFGATLYLNDWKKEWGGLFLWEDKGLHCLCPKKGMLVVNDKRQPHSVTPVSMTAPHGRRSIQIFAD